MTDTDIIQRSITKNKAAKEAFERLSHQFQVRRLEWDKNSLEVVKITHEQYVDICRQEQCSGIYNQKTERAIITNFQLVKEVMPVFEVLEA